MKKVTFVLLGIALLSEVSVAGPFCRARKSSSASTTRYYSPTVVYDYESPRRVIDYDRPTTSNDFGQYNGQVVNDASGTWKWDAESGLWRGPVTVTTYRDDGRGWVPTGSYQYWRK